MNQQQSNRDEFYCQLENNHHPAQPTSFPGHWKRLETSSAKPGPAMLSASTLTKMSCVFSSVENKSTKTAAQENDEERL